MRVAGREQVRARQSGLQAMHHSEDSLCPRWPTRALPPPPGSHPDPIWSLLPRAPWHLPFDPTHPHTRTPLGLAAWSRNTGPSDTSWAQRVTLRGRQPAAASSSQARKPEIPGHGSVAEAAAKPTARQDEQCQPGGRIMALRLYTGCLAQALSGTELPKLGKSQDQEGQAGLHVGVRVRELRMGWARAPGREDLQTPVSAWDSSGCLPADRPHQCRAHSWPRRTGQERIQPEEWPIGPWAEAEGSARQEEARRAVYTLL